MVEMSTGQMRRKPANYQLGREKTNPSSEMTRACEFALREEVQLGFRARALNSDSQGLGVLLSQLPVGS